MGASFCLKCKKRTTCKEICEALEKVLPKPQGGKSGRKLLFFDPSVLESIAAEQAFKLKFGRQKKTGDYLAEK